MAALVALLAVMMPFAGHTQEKVDAAMMQKIRKEGLENSKVMEIATTLCVTHLHGFTHHCVPWPPFI
jgi:hypothetical protein